MFAALFRAFCDRVKAAFVTDAAKDFETHLVLNSTERKAELYRQARAYEAEGLPHLAEELRARAAGLDLSQPLQLVLMPAGHLLSVPVAPISLPALAPPEKLEVQLAGASPRKRNRSKEVSK